MRSVYLAGPMNGIAESNFPAFRAARDDLRERGLVVVCPAEMNEGSGAVGAALAGTGDYAAFLLRDVAAIMEYADALVVLPGWERSTGTKIEIQWADMLGLPVLSYPTLEPLRSEFEEALQATLDGLRDLILRKNRAYGNSALEPVRIFSKADTAEQLRVRIDDKLSRLARGQRAGEDVLVDLLGYFVLLFMAEGLEISDGAT